MIRRTDTAQANYTIYRTTFERPFSKKNTICKGIGDFHKARGILALGPPKMRKYLPESTF
jgi:hypothetical protein